MNKQISILIVMIITMISFTACTDEDNLRFTTPEQVEQVTVTNSVLPQYLISSQTLQNVAERFTWEAPDFGVQSNVTYNLEYSIEGTFETSEVLASTNETQNAVTVEQIFNIATQELGLDTDPETNTVDENGDPVLDENGDPIPNDSGELFLRVNAQLGSEDAENAPESVSETIVMNIQMVEEGDGGGPNFKNLFLVGAATAPGWDNGNNNPPLVRDPENPNAFTFTGKFLDDQFKILEQRGGWQPQWGLDPDSGEVTSSDILGADPDVFTVPSGEGYYTININIDDLTYSIEATDISSAPTYSTIGIIGSATTGDDSGWGQDIDLTQSSFDPHLWYINGLELFDAEAKFRAGDAWDTNWGSDTELTGFGGFDGPNIPVSAGTYDVWFNDIDGSYVFILNEE
jgi:hypothetical protein